MGLGTRIGRGATIACAANLQVSESVHLFCGCSGREEPGGGASGGEEPGGGASGGEEPGDGASGGEEPGDEASGGLRSSKSLEASPSLMAHTLRKAFIIILADFSFTFSLSPGLLCWGMA